jgi:hypothetical protein
MDKRVIVSSLLGALLLFSGCSDKKSEESAKEESSSAPAKIKVTKNAVKVSDKKSEDKQNSGQFYYSYNTKEKSKEGKNVDKYNSETSKVRTTIDAYLNIKSPYERVRITMMIKRLSKDYIIRCSPCHDDYANGVIGPSLLDKDADFIYDRIMAFKEGKRDNALMKELVSRIDNSTLRSMSEEIANFNKEIRKMRMGK